MEIVIVDNMYFNATRFSSSDTLLQCSVPTYNPRAIRGKELHEEYITKLLEASNGKQHCIHIKKNPANTIDHYKCVLRLHGFFSENFETLCMDDLRVRIQISFSLNATGGTKVYQIYPLQMFAEIPIPRTLGASLSPVNFDNETCITDGVFLEATDVSVFYWNYLFSRQLGDNPSIRGCATISLLSDSTDLRVTENNQLAIADNPSRRIIRINRAILDSKLHSDVKISAKDGSEHSCNKSFLAAQSSVLKAMLETDMKESKTNKVEMKDMSSDGVQALLKYLYTFELDQAIGKCDIALELLEAGHKYDIESLERDVSSLILNQGEDWFSVDMAFNLFLFARKVESINDVKIKAASILMKKPKEFLECKGYVKERQENLAEAADQVQELFCLAVMK